MGRTGICFKTLHLKLYVEAAYRLVNILFEKLYFLERGSEEISQIRRGPWWKMFLDALMVMESW